MLHVADRALFSRMARPLRIEFAGALYHVTSRGDRQEAVYRRRRRSRGVSSHFGGGGRTVQLGLAYQVAGRDCASRSISETTRLSRRCRKRPGTGRSVECPKDPTQKALGTAGGDSRRALRAQCRHCCGVCHWRLQLPRDCRSFWSAPGDGGASDSQPNAIMRDLTPYICAPDESAVSRHVVFWLTRVDDGRRKSDFR